LLGLALGCIAAALAAAERVMPIRLKPDATYPARRTSYVASGCSRTFAWLRTAFLNPVVAASRLVEPPLRWAAGRIPGATPEAVGAFRIVFGSALLLYVLGHDVGAADVDPTSGALVAILLRPVPWIADGITAWLIVWGVLFVAGAAARFSFGMLTIGVFAWADLYTIDISHHTVSVLLVTLVCLLGARWGDAWSVDAWRRGASAGPKGPAPRAEKGPAPQARRPGPFGPGASPQAYGFTVWVPSFVLGVAFAAAAFAKLFQGGLGWILNGTVKYHFLSDSREALVDWGLRATQYDAVAVLLSFGAIAIEALVILGVLARGYVPRLAAGVAALLLLSGFVFFQGVIWPGWWMLLLSFLPWHRVGAAPPAPLARPAPPAYQPIVVLVLIALQTVISLLRVEVSPMLSAYDMYSTTYASPADFEAKASDAHWLVATDDTGRRHQCRLTRIEAESLTAAPSPDGALPPTLRQRCLDPSLRVKTLTVEADRVRVDWAHLRLEETGRVPLRSFVIRD